MSDVDRWELVEIFDGEEQVVGRYTDEARAKKACMGANLSSAPVEYGDCWGADYYVRRAQEAAAS